MISMAIFMKVHLHQYYKYQRKRYRVELEFLANAVKFHSTFRAKALFQELVGEDLNLLNPGPEGSVLT